MESGKLNDIERSILQSFLADGEFKKMMHFGFERQILGIPEIYHTDSEGNQRLLSIEETLEFLDKNSIDLEEKDGE